MTGVRSVLGSALFLPAPAQRLGLAGGVAVLAALVAGTALVLLRQAGLPLTATLWAEDGGVFLQTAYRFSLVDAFTTSYAGYYHLVPRLVAEAAGVLPVRHAAAAIAGLAALLTAVSGVLVWFATAGHLGSRWWRGLLALLVVVQPVAAQESLGTIALVQWHLLFAVFWLLLWRPPSTAGQVVATVAIAIATLSAPLVVVLAPLAVGRLVATETWGERGPPLAALAAAAVQVAVFLVVPGGRAGAIVFAPADLALVFGQRVVAVGVLGVAGAHEAWSALGTLLPVLLAVVLGVVLAVGLARGGGHRLGTAVVALGAAVALFVVPVVLRGGGQEMLWTLAAVTDVGSRYAVTPILLVASAIALAIDGLRAPRARAVVTGVLAVGLAVAVVADFRPVTRRSEGPAWRPAIAQAAAACAADPDADAQRVSIPPTVAGWALNVPCARL